MVLIYIDESGVANFTDPNNKIYVLGAVLVDEAEYQKLNLNVEVFKDRIINQYNLPVNDFEIHIAEFWSNTGLNLFGKILSVDDRLNILERVYSDILPFTNIKIITSVMLKEELSNKELNLRSWAIEILLERIKFFIDEESEPFGIIMMDTENDTIDFHKRRLVQLKVYYGTKYVKLREHIIPESHFLKSHLNSGIQLADAVVYSVRRFLEDELYGSEGVIGKRNNKIFKEYVYQKIRAYPNCKGRGIVFFPKIEYDI